MKFFTVRIGAPPNKCVNGVAVASITLEGVKAVSHDAAFALGEEVAGELYGWAGPGMHIHALQTGEEQRR